MRGCPSSYREVLARANGQAPRSALMVFMAKRDSSLLRWGSALAVAAGVAPLVAAAPAAMVVLTVVGAGYLLHLQRAISVFAGAAMVLAGTGLLGEQLIHAVHTGA